MSTPFLDDVYNRVDFDRELVFKFFTVFSLFEYALKQTSYKQVGRNDEVQADWDGFARDIHGQYDPNSSRELNEAITYFLNHPPMKQVIENGQVVF